MSSAVDRRPLRPLGDQIAKRTGQLPGEGGRRGVLRLVQRVLKQLRRGVKGKGKVLEGAGAMGTRASGTVGVAVLVALPVTILGLRGLRIVRVLERECERLHRIARAGRPLLRLVAVRLALVLLGVNERRDDETEDRHCGKERRPV